MGSTKDPVPEGTGSVVDTVARRLGATDGERLFAAGIAQGVYTLDDIPPTMDRLYVELLAELYAQERPAPLTVDDGRGHLVRLDDGDGRHGKSAHLQRPLQVLLRQVMDRQQLLCLLHRSFHGEAYILPACRRPVVGHRVPGLQSQLFQADGAALALHRLHAVGPADGVCLRVGQDPLHPHPR